MTRHIARERIVATAYCALVASAVAIGCGKGSPTAPDSGQAGEAPAVVTALRIEGNLQLAAPNESGQLRALAIMSAGPTREVTQLATWRIVGEVNAVTVSAGGLIKSFNYGTDVVTVTYQSVKATVSVRVMPPGMHMLAGYVREAGALPVYDALVEVVDGPSAGRR